MAEAYSEIGTKGEVRAARTPRGWGRGVPGQLPRVSRLPLVRLRRHVVPGAGEVSPAPAPGTTREVPGDS